MNFPSCKSFLYESKSHFSGAHLARILATAVTCRRTCEEKRFYLVLGDFAKAGTSAPLARYVKIRDLIEYLSEIFTSISYADF